jgi:hypothetical protein
VDHLEETLRTGDLAALTTGIDLLEQAVGATPTDHPAHARYLTNLAAALSIRFERTGSDVDLDTAVEASQQAVDAIPTDHPGRADYLTNLARLRL